MGVLMIMNMLGINRDMHDHVSRDNHIIGHANKSE